MKRLVRFAAALTAVLSLTACTAEVGTGTVTSNLLPCVTAEPEKEEDTTMLDKDIIKSTITSTDDGNGNYTNPVIFADVPDIDIIRVDDAFYMVSTTMHLSPGCPIMRSYDLVNWEIVNYVFDTLEDSDKLALRNGENNYGKGQWATTLRYNDGVYYAGFTSFSTGKTYIYHTDDIENGKWDRFVFDECFHDMSLLFDDGKVYLVYGGGQIWYVELEKDLSAVKPGTKRKLINNAGLVKDCLAEGSHVYKLNGYYYIFIITWPPHSKRTQLCYRSKALDGEWEMKVIIDDNMGFRNDGAAQGGIVDDKDGNWYCFVFQDHGAVGRTPVLSTMTWEDGWPVVGVDGKVPKTAKIPIAGHEKKSVVTSDEFINSQIVRSYHSFADTPEDSNMTLGEWLDRWINEYMIFTIRESTLDSYKAMIKNQIKPYLGDRPLSVLTTQELQKFYNSVKKKGRVKPDRLHGTELADSMVRGIHMMLHEALDMAVRLRLIVKNPTVGTTIPKNNYPPKQILNDEQLDRFMKRIRQDERWYDFFYTELTTGLRRGEICGLKWEDFDAENGKLKVRRSVAKRKGGGLNIGETKTETGTRTIVLPPSTAELLRKRKETAVSEWIFPNIYEPEKPMHPDYAYHRLKTLLKQAELPLIRFHDLRHTFATHALAGGVDAKTLSGILGHTNASFTLDTYTHVTTDMQRNASAIVGSFMDEIMLEGDDTNR